MLASPRDPSSISLWQNVSDADWGDYRWQLRNRLEKVEHIEAVVTLTADERSALGSTADLFRFGLSPHYATLIDPDDPWCPIRRQAIPLCSEMNLAEVETPDPLLEEASSPTPALLHRYPDRVLLLATHECSLYCRYCTRRRIVGDGDGVSTADITKAIDYIRSHSSVRDVLLSGGDPLLLSDARLDWILGEIRAIEHVQIIRIGSRLPVTIPQRITSDFVSMLRRHSPIWLNTHVNHPLELAHGDTRRALNALADGGIPTGNQTVLLKGVNDCPVVLRRLFEELVILRCRPYYLYQCDLAPGLGAVRTSLDRGLAIMNELWGSTTGFAIPMFVIDAPGKRGKVPILPNTVLGRDVQGWIVQDRDGLPLRYPLVEDDVIETCRLCGGDHSASRAKIARTFAPSDVLSTGSSVRARSMRAM